MTPDSAVRLGAEIRSERAELERVYVEAQSLGGAPDSTAEALGRLLRLRHVLRNLYAWTIRRDELDAHLRELSSTHATLVRELDAFQGFLSACSSGSGD